MVTDGIFSNYVGNHTKFEKIYNYSHLKLNVPWDFNMFSFIENCESRSE